MKNSRYQPGWRPRVEGCDHEHLAVGMTLRSPGETSLTVAGISCTVCGEHVTVTWATDSLPDINMLDVPPERRDETN